MPRNMSFFMTTEQVKAQTKDVTRRMGWYHLKPGEHVNAVYKAMGLQLGEKVERLALIEVVSLRIERLSAITQADVVREGFPDKSPEWFIDMICKHYSVPADVHVNRIEFKYINNG